MPPVTEVMFSAMCRAGYEAVLVLPPGCDRRYTFAVCLLPHAWAQAGLPGQFVRFHDRLHG